MEGPVALDHPDARPPTFPPVPGAPDAGPADPAPTELTPGEEPVATGTLFLTILILMLIGAIWVIVYARLINR